MLSSIMEARSSILVFFLNSILINFLAFSTAQLEGYKINCSNNSENYLPNGHYHVNLLTFLISTNSTPDYGFYNKSVGQNPNTVRGIALCRGDFPVDSCQICIRLLTWKIIQDCSLKKEAIGWYRRCMLRYSHRPILGVMENQPVSCMSNDQNVTNNVSEFRRTLQELLGNLKSKAAAGDWRRKFAIGNKTTTDFQKIYGLVQCTPNLSKQDCTDCLEDIIRQLPDRCCDRRTQGRIMNPSCNIWFSTQNIFDRPLELAPLTPSSRAKGNGNKRSQKVIIIAATASSVSFILITCIYFFISLRVRKNVGEIRDVDHEDEIISVEYLQFDFSTIMVATDSFSIANKLGEGGFGPVYKGKLSNGKVIAVKRLSKQSRQGDREFKNEVFLVAKLQHRNLVRLLGFCLESNERLLIYEFVPNSSLDRFIFDPSGDQPLDWEGRYKIIRGIARGLLYLHEDSQIRIIHRDLKASNILLDSEMNPKISDFGLARLFEPDNTQGNTSRVVGTFGYMAPEYLKNGHFSTKSDVFSFGVLVLEIVTGQHNSFFGKTEDSDLLTCAWECWSEGEALKLIDPTLQANSTSEILRCIHIGLLCVQENVADRPTMSSILLMLSSCSIALPVPLKPAFFVHNSGLTKSAESNARFALASTNEVTITELGPR